MTETLHVKKGTVLSFKPVQIKKDGDIITKYITHFSVDNDEYEGGAEYVTLWLHKKPYCRQEWRLYIYNFRWSAIEPLEQ